MANAKSNIGWTDATWSPVTGCSKVSPGCSACYAEALTERFAGRPGWIEEHRPWTPANAAHNVRLHLDRLEQPLRWRRPRMIFVNSMSDLFHEQIPDEYIAEVFAVMWRAEHHKFQVLTKRPERMRELLRRTEFIEELDGMWPEWERLLPWPLPNVWLGTSIENRRFVHRADLLRQTPAAVRFISAEPLLGPLIPSNVSFLAFEETMPASQRDHWPWEDDYVGPFLDLAGIDWLICGGESGPHHRPMRMEWARDLRDACRCADTAFFFKQWGGGTPKAGGRELDGRTWDEMPASATHPSPAPLT